MKRINKYVLLLILLSSQIFATGNNIYTRYGLGDLNYSFSARRMALGELGIGIKDFDYLNGLNPAGWTQLRLTRFETGFVMDGSKISSDAGSSFHSKTIFNGLMLGFPIDREYGISFVTGLAPYSKVSYELSFDNNDELVGNHNLIYSGDGGLYKGIVGLSYNLPFDLALGISLDYYNGHINYQSSITFDQASTYRDAAFTRQYTHNGLGFTVGLISSNLASIFSSDILKDLRLGIVYSSGSNITTDTLDISTTILGDISTSSGEVTTKLPERFGVGLSFKLTDSYQFLLDYLFQPMSKFSRNNYKVSNLRDMMKISFGMEYRNPEFRSQSFWELMMLRIGLSYEQTQYEINGKGIDELSVYTGFSMPLSFDNTIDFAFQYGVRGTTENKLLKENIYRFSVTLSVGELWFLRQDR